MLDNGSYNSKFFQDHYLPNNPRGSICIDPFHRGGRFINGVADCAV